MSLEKDKYRNPPPPLGYVKKMPELVLKKNNINQESINISRIIKIIDSGICDEPDISRFENFTINASSEEEEIIEVPVVPRPVEVLDIVEEENKKSSENIITVKKELEHPVIHPEASVPDKRAKKHARHKRKHKKTKKKKGDISDSSHTGSSYYINKRKLDADSDSGTNRSQSKETSYSSGSDSYSRSKQKRRDSYDSDSYSRNKQKMRDSYDSDSYSKSKQKIRDSYDSDSDSHSNSRHKRSRYRRDSKSHNRDRYKRRNSHSHHRRLSEKNDSDNKFSGETSASKRFDKESDSDSDFDKTQPKKEFNTVKTEYTFVRIGKKEPIPSPCPPTENCKKEYVETDTNISQEPCLLYGDYRCEICNVTVNSEAVYESHINGKKHKKAVEKAQSESKVISKVANKLPLPPLCDSKYPKPSPGYCRKKLDCPSVIQAKLDSTDKFPCPGLDKITEIRRTDETTYYCSFCDIHCTCNSIIQHISGFKHQLNSVKYYRNDLYQKWGHKQKFQIINDVISVLRTEEKRNGRGVVEVEKDYKETDTPDVKTKQIVRITGHDEPSTSKQSQDMEFMIDYTYSSMPDPTKSGYYCKLCDSHSNSEAMWQSHIIGKRHVTNLKKNPGAFPSKCKYIPAEKNVRPKLFDLLLEENIHHSPVVGLSQIREILKPDINGVLFNCFLCGGCMSSLEIVSHVLSMKHKEKYLKSKNHPEMETLSNCQISESYRSSIVEEICAAVEAEEGSGTPDVYYAKNAVRNEL